MRENPYEAPARIRTILADVSDPLGKTWFRSSGFAGEKSGAWM